MARVAHRRRLGRSRLGGAGAAGLAALAALTLIGAVAGSDSPGAVDPPRPSGRSWVDATVRPGSVQSAPDRWTKVLNRLDRRRAQAYAAGDPAALAAVYERGSTVLAHDRAMLAAYVGRGFTVRGASMRLLAVRARRAPGGVVLRVVDRLRAAAARSGSGAIVSLPRDRPTVHRLVLHRDGGRWRITAVAAMWG